jgi:hypothetical protein
MPQITQQSATTQRVTFALFATAILIIVSLNVWLGTFVVVVHPEKSLAFSHNKQYQQDSAASVAAKKDTDLEIQSTTTNAAVATRSDSRGWPPLNSIAQGWNITGNPSRLLDFAIVGFSKCGTSSLMFHLQKTSRGLHSFGQTLRLEL